jgi:hypothetical protein
MENQERKIVAGIPVHSQTCVVARHRRRMPDRMFELVYGVPKTSMPACGPDPLNKPEAKQYDEDGNIITKTRLDKEEERETTERYSPSRDRTRAMALVMTDRSHICSCVAHEPIFRDHNASMLIHAQDLRPTRNPGESKNDQRIMDSLSLTRLRNAVRRMNVFQQKARTREELINQRQQQPDDPNDFGNEDFGVYAGTDRPQEAPTFDVSQFLGEDSGWKEYVQGPDEEEGFF